MCNKRLLTSITAGSYYFFIGLELGIIIPSLNLFILDLGGESRVIGLCISAMSFSGFISAPVFGRVANYIGKIKVVVVLADMFTIGGNFMYFASTTPYMIVISRFIVGVSAGVGPLMTRKLTRATVPEQRTSLLSRVYAGRHVGCIFGPALNFFLIHFNFKLFSFHVNKYTAPGFFMTILWSIHLIMTMFCYYDLDSVPNSSSVDCNYEITSETSRETVSERAGTSYGSTVCQDLLSEQNILIVFGGFVNLFVFNAMETIRTPLSLRFFDWKIDSNSIYYSSTALLYALTLVSLSFSSKKFSNRSLLLFGITAVTLNQLMFLLFVIFAVQQPKGNHNSWMLALFITNGVFMGLTLSYALVPAVSIFSKITYETNQGFNRGVLLMFRQLARILAPLWGSYLLDDLPLMAGVLFGLLFLVFVMHLISYKRFPSAEDNNENLTIPSYRVESGSFERSSRSIGERTPLLLSNSN